MSIDISRRFLGDAGIDNQNLVLYVAEMLTQFSKQPLLHFGTRLEELVFVHPLDIMLLAIQCETEFKNPAL